MKNPFDKVLNWYFSKNSLPYWCIFLIDCAIVMFSGFLVFWIFNDAESVFENTLQILNTMLCFVLLCIPGFRIFHTYSGFMRYSSFVDLMRVVYGNLVSLALVLVAQFAIDHLPRDYFIHFNTTSLCLILIISTLLMWALRVFVKTLYDVAFSNTRAVRVLIYGARWCRSGQEYPGSASEEICGQGIHHPLQECQAPADHGRKRLFCR